MRSVPSLVVAALALLALTSCQPDEAPIIPDPVPTSDLLFESEDEALAAAEEAFGEYLRVVDEISANGGQGSESLSEVATSAVVTQDEQGFAELRTQGMHSVGSTTYDTLTVQQYEPSGTSLEAVVVIYVCEDFSGTDVLDQAGQSVLALDRQTRWPLVVTLDVDDSTSSSLIVAAVDDWTGANFCE